MSSKRIRHKFSQRRFRTNNNHHGFDKKIGKNTFEQKTSDLIQQFNFYCTTLRTKATFIFDIDEENNHRCKMILPIFPNLQSIGTGGKTKKEAKANSIIAFLAHMDKRKQVGLFVPYLIPNLLRNVQNEVRRANVATPDLNLNTNEYLLSEHITSKRKAKKNEKIIEIFERICDVRVIKLWQSAKMTFVYIVGSKTKEELIRPYVKALFQPENEQMFNYGEKLSNIFNDEKFLNNVCQRLKVLCENHSDKNKLFIRGSSVNVQCCYNEFVVLRREFENEFYQNEKRILSNSNQLKTIDNTDEQILIEDKNNDQLPDYSIYDDDVNESILKVLRNEENSDENTIINKSLEIIEVSDDSSDSAELEIVHTVKPKIPVATTVQNQNMTQPPVRILRPIVLDGQNIARNSNDFNRLFSWSRLSNAINYFKNRGHENIIAFLPLYLREYSNKNSSANEMNRERQIRDYLINSRYIAFTPSRYTNGHRLTNYDDRFILQYAADIDGVVVSNDNFRDLQHEKTFQFVINNRILPFATINDTFMPATDPLGRNGPNLDEFLSKMSL